MSIHSLFGPNRHLRTRCRLALSDSINSCCSRSIKCNVAISVGNVAACSTLLFYQTTRRRSYHSRKFLSLARVQMKRRQSPDACEVHAIEQQLQFMCAQFDRSALARRPPVLAALQSLVPDCQSVAIPDNCLDPIGAL